MRDDHVISPEEFERMFGLHKGDMAANIYPTPEDRVRLRLR